MAIHLKPEAKFWRLLIHDGLSAACNMAVDEAIMKSHVHSGTGPTLRLYRWNPPAVSIGYFQNLDQEVDTDACRQLGLDIVRRPTGGRAVLHHKEITYSVVISSDLLPGSVLETYCFLAKGMLAGLQWMGLDVRLTGRGTRPDRGSAACFDSPSWYELVSRGRKLVGSAQTRRGGVLLQHGSVLLDLDLDSLSRVFAFPDEKTRSRFCAVMERKATAVNDELAAAGKPRAAPEDLIDAIVKGFEKGLNITLEPGRLSSAELNLAAELREQKYSSQDWNRYKRPETRNKKPVW